MKFSAQTARMVSRVLSTVVPADRIVPVMSGPLKGTKWVVGSGNHAAWLGVYELRKQRLFERFLRQGMAVHDVGAHVGAYTLLASRLVGPDGQVVAFEPLPRNLEFLHRHVRLNQSTNVHVIAAAVSDTEGTQKFEAGPSAYEGRLALGGTANVQSVTIDGLVERGEIKAPDLIKMDIEGAELAALRGASRTLQRSRPTVFLATHGVEAHRGCLALLDSLGYEVSPLLPGQKLSATDEVIACHRGR